LVAKALYLTNDIETYGSGCRRVREQIADYPALKLDFMETRGAYLVKVSYSEQIVGK
jgi:predicted HTH transcriptional regulator